MKLRVKCFILLSSCKRVEGKINRMQAVLLQGKGRITCNDVYIGYPYSPQYMTGSSYIEARFEDAEIVLGKSHINNNFSCIAEHGRISIGDDCLIGTNVQIINSDFHPISVAERHNLIQKSKDVTIGNNVFIGNNVSITKGVTIGDNAVIANGSVVFDDVAANTIVRGNPAVFYKQLEK